MADPKAVLDMGGLKVAFRNLYPAPPLSRSAFKKLIYNIIYFLRNYLIIGLSYRMNGCREVKSRQCMYFSNRKIMPDAWRSGPPAKDLV